MSVSVTVGLEFEVHRLQGVRPDNREYNRVLHEEKVARIISELDLNNIFPEQASSTSHLCMIQKRQSGGSYRNFVAVTFDDNAEMNRLEFISVGSGILPAKDFLSRQNLLDIRDSAIQFPESVNIAAIAEHGSFQRSADAQFRFIVPDYAKSFFTQQEISLDPDKSLRNAGSIHVTHTFDTSRNGSSAKFLGACGCTVKGSVLETPVSVIGKRFNNSLRGTLGPNSKTSEELLKECKDEKKLFPMSNTVGELTKDMDAYSQVSRMIEARKQATGNEGEKALLQMAQDKVHATQDFLIRRSRMVGANVADESKRAENLRSTICVFESYESKLRAPIEGNLVLVEHRDPKDPIVRAVAGIVRDGLPYESQSPLIGKAVEILEEIAPREMHLGRQREMVQRGGAAIADTASLAAQHSTTQATTAVSALLAQHENLGTAPAIVPVVSGANAPMPPHQSSVRHARSLKAALTADRPITQARSIPAASASQDVILTPEERRRQKLAEDTKKHADRLALARARKKD